MQSFIKDLILFALILFIVFGIKYIKPVLMPGINLIILLISILIVLWFQWFVLRHLPVKDCLPFKKGNNLIRAEKNAC